MLKMKLNAVWRYIRLEAMLAGTAKGVDYISLSTYATVSN